MATGDRRRISWVVARPTAVMPIVIITATMGLLLLMLGFFGGTADPALRIVVIAMGLGAIGLSSFLLLSRSALLSGHQVRGAMPRRRWIPVTDPGQVLVVDSDRAENCYIVVRLADGDHRILSCFDTRSWLGTRHIDKMQEARARIIARLRFDPGEVPGS